MDPPPTPRHFIVATIGSAGDLFPFLRVALALRARGHRVDFIAPALLEGWVRQSGLSFHGLPVDATVLADPDLWHARKGFGVVWRATRPPLQRLPALVAQLAQGRPCTLLVHPLALPEADLCRASMPGIAIAAAWLAPSNLPSVHDPMMLGPHTVPAWVPLGLRRWLWRQGGKRLLDPIALPGLNAARRAFGLAPVASFLDYLYGVADLSVTLFPDWFAPRQPDWPQPLACGDFALYEPAPGAPLAIELSTFLGQGDPPVVFTHGTGNQQAARFFSCAVAAVQRLGLRAVLLTPHRGQVPDRLPATVLWLAYQPLRPLLPCSIALVHHGGIGTTAEALRAGLPQLVLPLAHDQFDNGARVVALRTGRLYPGRRLVARRLAASLGALIADQGIVVHCRAIQGRFGPAPQLGPVLGALAALGRAARPDLL